MRIQTVLKDLESHFRRKDQPLPTARPSASGWAGQTSRLHDSRHSRPGVSTALPKRT